jgi:hypothetical protein
LPSPQPSTPQLLLTTVRPLTPLGDDGVDQVLGDAAQAEAAGDDRHVVAQGTGERRLRVGVDLPHASPSRLAVVERGPGPLVSPAGPIR